MSKILIAEDEASIRRVLMRILTEENAGYELSEAADGQEAMRKASEGFDLVLCDIKMPLADGVEVLEHYRKTAPETAMVMISGHGDLELAVQCMRMGAYDFISKPMELNRLLQTVRNALDRTALVQQLQHLRKKVDRQHQMIGSGPAIQSIRTLIEKVAPTDARVLITGPNGSGKELVAHGIHQASARSKSAFVEVNCAAIPAELIESELFGHVKGAFTSAVKDRKGKFEQAEGGTLFLDEIGDMSLSAQAKVLRALQENRISPVGGEKSIAVNARVLAATNKDLTKEIAEGRFREDLYHRLSVIRIEVPSLNKRKEDIPDLVAHFSAQIQGEQKLPPKSFSTRALSALAELDYTGNIRQLRNLVERLLILGSAEISAEEVRQYA
ncbi:response regulator [bacterium]|nr:response regulator [bacterium]